MADVIHKVKAGETLSAIATQNNITLGELLAANPAITNPNQISVGQEITIPTAQGSGGGQGPTESTATEGRLDNVSGFAVEQREIPRPGNKPFFFNSHTRIGVLHTTEGRSVESSFNSLRDQFSAPHFLIGEGRIIQCRPLTAQGSALRGEGPCFANAQASIQIEMVGFTGGGNDGSTTENLWLPKDEVLLPTVAIMAFCAGNGIDIPLRVPKEEWKDNASDMPLPWAVRTNSRRIAAMAGAFPSLKGWWMHVEVPCQGPTFHHDCGRLRRREMIAKAQELLSS